MNALVLHININENLSMNDFNGLIKFIGSFLF
jgi:hypothetical protein